MGEWQKAPSGVNQTKKLEILAKEGVEFDERGMLKDKKRLWDEFVERKYVPVNRKA